MSKAIRINGRVYRATDITRDLVYPQPGGQYAAYWSDAFEVLGGGSAGGGKSWFLVLDALGLQFKFSSLRKAAYQCHGYRAVLFRRESTQLDRLISEAKTYYPQYGGVFVGGRQGEPGPCFEFPEYGSKIFFCHMQNENDKENHQGQEYQFVGFDELTHFTVTQYLYMFSRLRSKIPGLWPRVRSTTNPTGEGLWWVRKRFVDNWKPGTMRYFLAPEDPANDPRGKWVKPGTKDSMSRVFIPFWLDENKILALNDPGYSTRTKALGRQMEKALLGGDWYAFGGDLFPDFDRHVEIIKPASIPKDWRLMLSIDPGFSSPCAAILAAAGPRDQYYIIWTYYVPSRNADEHARAIRKMIMDCHWTNGRWPDRIVSGRDAFAKNDKYAVVASDKTFAEAFQEIDRRFFLEPATTDRIPGWWNWKRLMPNQFYLFENENEFLLDEMAAAVADEKVPEDLKGRGNDPTVKDHALDACRYLLEALAPPPKPEKKDEGWESAWRRQQNPERQGWKVGTG